jgi:hypothetical protein
VSTDLRAGQGGGYVNGGYYPDKSGVCGLSIPPAGGGEIQYMDIVKGSILVPFESGKINLNSNSSCVRR